MEIASNLNEAIISLCFVKDEGRGLGMIGGYTVLFAMGLFFCTTGQKGEIFGAIAPCVILPVPQSSAALLKDTLMYCLYISGGSSTTNGK
jgi:hypothetical protein